MRIDFVSDVTCPWCAIGFTALEQALGRLAAEVPVELHLQPFELNPDMPPEGEDIVRYMARKYGKSPEDVADRQAEIRGPRRRRRLRLRPRTRTWNTFDAHRAAALGRLEGRQRELKRALLAAYHTRGENPGARDVLLRLAGEVGLDVESTRAVLDRRRVRRRGARAAAPLAGARHPLGAVGDRRRAPPDPGRPAGRGVRAGAARDRRRPRRRLICAPKLARGRGAPGAADGGAPACHRSAHTVNPFRACLSSICSIIVEK
jgi:predicted DsbA family dithiol-disulfide isomerase